jgi:2-methylcitrate dehydratase PrpD
MTFKNHACCGHTFAAIDGALELKKRMQVKAEDIEQVEVATYKAGVEVAHYENPRTPAEGRFSLKYVVATALCHGSVRLAAFEPERLADRDTANLMRKIKASVDPQLEAEFPAKRAARVAIRARGRREEWLQPTRIGDPDAPLSDRSLEEKYFELATPVIGEAKAKQVLARLWRLE